MWRTPATGCSMSCSSGTSRGCGRRSRPGGSSLRPARLGGGERVAQHQRGRPVPLANPAPRSDHGVSEHRRRRQADAGGPSVHHHLRGAESVPGARRRSRRRSANSEGDRTGYEPATCYAFYTNCELGVLVDGGGWLKAPVAHEYGQSAHHRRRPRRPLPLGRAVGRRARRVCRRGAAADAQGRGGKQAQDRHDPAAGAVEDRGAAPVRRSVGPAGHRR